MHKIFDQFDLFVVCLIFFSEQDEHVGKMTRNIKAPGFLIQPLNSSERDKKYNTRTFEQTRGNKKGTEVSFNSFKGTEIVLNKPFF